MLLWVGCSANIFVQSLKDTPKPPKIFCCRVINTNLSYTANTSKNNPQSSTYAGISNSVCSLNVFCGKSIQPAGWAREVYLPACSHYLKGQVQNSTLSDVLRLKSASSFWAPYSSAVCILTNLKVAPLQVQVNLAVLTYFRRQSLRLLTKVPGTVGFTFWTDHA